MSCGIYKIENLLNHKVYIGQSINIETRIKKHKSAKDNFLIHKAIQKYGKDNFSYDIIELCPYEQLNEREIYWIDYYQSCVLNGLNKGYNMDYGGDNGAGLKKGQPVEQYSLSGEYIKTYPSARQAAAALNISPSSISSCVNNRNKMAGGYQWKKVNDDKVIEAITPSNKGSFAKIEKYDLKGNFIQTYENLEEAAKSVGGGKPGVCKACKQHLPYLNYLWKYTNDQSILSIPVINKIGQYDLSGNLLKVFESAAEASRETYTVASTICEACKGKRKTANGFIWKYIQE